MLFYSELAHSENIVLSTTLQRYNYPFKNRMRHDFAMENNRFCWVMHKSTCCTAYFIKKGLVLHVR